MATTSGSAAARSARLTVAIAAATVLVILAGLMAGARPLSPVEVARALLTPDAGIISFFVWDLRLPRSLAAGLAGAGLGVSGYILQTLTRNPLAGPALTGVTAGAVAPIVLVTVTMPSVSASLHPWIGLAGGLAAMVLVFWISGGGNQKPLHLALGGVAVSLFLGALTTYALLLAGPQATSLLFWLSGGFQGRTWTHLGHLAPWVLIGLAGAVAARRVLGLLALDEAAATAMGVDLTRWRPVLLVLAALPVAGIAPIGGPIAFVGLAAPHVARLLKPAGPGWTLALSAAIGGLVLTLADVLARSVAAPRELPVGILTALLGGSVFIALVLRPEPIGGRAA